jgi:hypothetical protein
MHNLDSFFNLPKSSRILDSNEWWQLRHRVDLKIAPDMFRDVARWVQFEQPGFRLLNVEWRVFNLRYKELRTILASIV